MHAVAMQATLISHSEPHSKLAASTLQNFAEALHEDAHHLLRRETLVLRHLCDILLHVVHRAGVDLVRISDLRVFYRKHEESWTAVGLCYQ